MYQYHCVFVKEKLDGILAAGTHGVLVYEMWNGHAMHYFYNKRKHKETRYSACTWSCIFVWQPYVPAMNAENARFAGRLPCCHFFHALIKPAFWLLMRMATCD
jgi:hypothetical protein